ncbi:unnamed protein product, partial [marine sediment metagenome]
FAHKHILSPLVCVIVSVLAATGVDDALGQDEHSAQVSEARWATVNVDARSSEVYGTPWNADSLANINLGRWGYEVSFRISAEKSGHVRKLRYYDMHGQSGYSGGDGGEVRIELQTDDGSGAHRPSGTVLASGFIREPLKETLFPLVTFDRPARVTEGELYHIVFTNPDPDPNTNFTSVNCLYMKHPLTPQQPSVSDRDLAVVWRQVGKTEWDVRRKFTPIYDLCYEDGTAQGV